MEKNMKSIHATLIALTAFALTTVSTTCLAAADDDNAKLNKLIANYAARLDVGTISLNWNEQAEVKKIRALPDIKRTAAILATIWNLSSNDETIFSDMKTNDYQVLVSMLTRIHSYTFLSNLTAASANDLLLNEYLNQEVAELKQVFAKKNTVTAYMQARKIRDDRQAVLLKDQKFVNELVKYRAGKEPVTKTLANATTMLALLEACTANVELCLKMESP
jgi:hypothetical protein